MLITQKVLITILFFLYFQKILLPQSDSLIAENNKLLFHPSFHSLQIDGNSCILIYEFGGQLDFDLFRSNNNVCIGTRMSVEHYAMGDFGGSILGSPFTNYNLYFRLTKTNDYLSTNVLAGISNYKTNAPDYVPNDNLFRAGFEVKYGKVVSLILKGSTSFKEKTTFVGLGISLDYNHLL